GEPSGVDAFARRLKAAGVTLTPCSGGRSLVLAEVGDLRAQVGLRAFVSLGGCLPPEAVGPAEIAGYPAALIIKMTKGVLSVSVSSVGGPGIPLSGRPIVLREVMPQFVHPAQLHVG